MNTLKMILVSIGVLSILIGLLTPLSLFLFSGIGLALIVMSIIIHILRDRGKFD